MARLFFALWPDEAARAALAARSKEVALRCGGRPVPAANLHLTLAFLGEVDPGRVPALHRAARPGRTAAFELALDWLGAFARARVAWAGCGRPPEELIALQAGLALRIREAGFALEERPFAVHLTLARRIRTPLAPEPMEAVRWKVSSFALVESVRGEGAYRTLAEWPLEGEGT
jgi:2'-5' RNA ligase